MLDKVITYSFYLLFFLTPLFWTSLNYELFEFNKMNLAYGITVLIVGCWILKMVQEKTFIFKRTPLDIPLLLFLGANILSTIFSIDTHTSIWGYYSRLNGGLLSTVTYLLLYWAFVSNMDKDKVLTLLKVGLASGFIISLYAISEHFGVSPSCVFLRGEFNADCWVQRVQERVFATLGQPNWLAAYLSMLIFPALYFLLTATSRKSLTTYYILLTTYYLAFTFTYSRGPTLGLICGMAVFLGLLLFFERKRKEFSLRQLADRNVKPVLLVIGSFLIINLLFGSALTSFRLISKFSPPTRPVISLTQQVGTQLETGGTESGQIRFIVWQGALEIFKHYPIFGSGVETFAYSYYQFRPAAHNLTSEWDFLYNKAHNEYLNYLATTGLAGFTTYMIVILTFVVWSIKSILGYYDIKRKNISQYPYILIPILLASYISYLIYNIFLFSVVIIAIFFYLFPALAFVFTQSIKPLKLTINPNPKTKGLILPSILHTTYYILHLIYRRPLYTKFAKGIIIFTTLYLLFSIFKLWYADTIFKKGQNAIEAGSAGKAYNLLSAAKELNRDEPFYRSELAYSAAAASAALEQIDATLSAVLKDEALEHLDSVLKQSPNNVSFWRTAIRTYFELSSLDKKYVDETLKALDQAIKLAPTDPKLYYNKALILETLDKKDEAIKAFKQAINLRPDYLEAKQKLEEATTSAKP